MDALSAKRFIMDVTAGSDYRETPERWLNVSMGPIMSGPDFELANQRRICDTYNTDEASVTLHGCDANILPKLAPVDLHHDFTGGICTASAIHPVGSAPGKVVKLWFFWPHSNTTYLLNHNFHRDRAFFQHLRDGMFRVQLEGETMLIPARGITLHFYCDALAASRLAILFP